MSLSVIQKNGSSNEEPFFSVMITLLRYYLFAAASFISMKAFGFSMTVKL